MAVGLRRSSVLRECFKELLVPRAECWLTHMSARSYGALEAAWLLDPATWWSLAQNAFAASTLPGSSGDERFEWFSYFVERADERGYEVPGGFRRRSTISQLGVPRKSDPAQLAIDALFRIRREPGRARFEMLSTC